MGNMTKEEWHSKIRQLADGMSEAIKLVDIKGILREARFAYTSFCDVHPEPLALPLPVDLVEAAREAMEALDPATTHGQKAIDRLSITLAAHDAQEPASPPLVGSDLVEARQIIDRLCAECNHIEEGIEHYLMITRDGDVHRKLLKIQDALDVHDAKSPREPREGRQVQCMEKGSFNYRFWMDEHWAEMNKDLYPNWRDWVQRATSPK